MRITGLVFVGTRTTDRAAMATFAGDVLGLQPASASGLDADLFELPDGSFFAVAAADEGRSERTVGFLVADLDGAVAELRTVGVEVDDASANERFRYAHFRGPDGRLYELVEARRA